MLHKSVPVLTSTDLKSGLARCILDHFYAHYAIADDDATKALVMNERITAAAKDIKWEILLLGRLHDLADLISIVDVDHETSITAEPHGGVVFKGNICVYFHVRHIIAKAHMLSDAD